MRKEEHRKSKQLGRFLVGRKKKYVLDVYSAGPFLGIFDDLVVETVNYAFPFIVKADVYELGDGEVTNRVLTGEKLVFCLLFLKEGQKRGFNVNETDVWNHVVNNKGLYFAEIFEEDVVPAIVLPEDSDLKNLLNVRSNVIYLPLKKGFEAFEKQVVISQEYLQELKKAVNQKLKEITESIFVEEREGAKEKVADFLGEFRVKGRNLAVKDVITVYFDLYGKHLADALQGRKKVKNLKELKKICSDHVNHLKKLTSEKVFLIEKKARSVLNASRTLFPEKEVSLEGEIDALSSKKRSLKTRWKPIKNVQ